MTDPEPARRLPPTVLATCVLPWDDRLRLDEGAFRETCGRFGQAQFLHYNLMRAGRILRGADYRRLADAVPNLVGTKITGSDPNSQLI